jgi:membrane associated rhomboid family serine protease
MRPNWGNQGRYEGGSWLPFNWYSIPATRFLLFATVGTFIAFFLFGQNSGLVAEWVPLVSLGDWTWIKRPWTLVTYPFLEMPGLWYLLTLYLLYSYGGMMERAWGSWNFLVLFFAFSAIGALSVGIGSAVLGQPAALAGLGVPLCALVTAWAALDPELETNFWGVPVKAKFIAAVWVAMLFIQFGMGNRLALAPFVLVGPAAAFLYVRKMPRLNISIPGRRQNRWAPDLRDTPRERPRRETPRESVGGFNPLRRRREQAEMERLRKLLGEDDDDRPRTRN